MTTIAEIIDFKERNEEHLRSLELGLMELPQKEAETIDDLLRHVVSLGTEAEFLDLKIVVNITDYFTKYFKKIRDYWLTIDQDLTTYLLQLFDCLEIALVQEIEIINDQQLESDLEEQIQDIVKIIEISLDKLLQKHQLFQEINKIFPLESSLEKIGQGYGKKVALTMVGGQVAIPQSILMQLRRILPHLINNAIAHGIESPEIRQSLGKPIAGEITLQAKHSAQKITIIFADDGGGIEQNKVKNKAIAKKLITPEKAMTLTEVEIYEFLFNPDFSTKKERDLIAGTGYGLDIVRSELAKRGATITISSKIGQGTKFEINYPYREG